MLKYLIKNLILTSNLLILIGLSSVCFTSCQHVTKPSHLPVVKDTSSSFKQSNSELSKLQSKNDFIYLNTIDGVFYAIGKNDGKIKWSFKEEAVLKFPKNYENPYFLTDPRDGSLYIFTNQREGLKKFPYTIAELVSASPSKSSDGYLYTGDKKDEWLAVDYRNGHKLDTLTAETLNSKISISDENILFIGRTQYTISMFDVNTRKKIFNLTYYDYSTHAHASKINTDKPATQSANVNKNRQEDINLNHKKTAEYPFYHFSSSSDGTLVTLDKRTGELIWQIKLDHPIIAMYRYENEQLFKINFAIFAVEALTNLNPNRYMLLHKEQINQDQESNNFSQHQQQSNKATNSRNPGTVTPSPSNNKLPSSDLFVSTLYIGFYKNNLYAMPALIYNWQLAAIDGPHGNILSLPNLSDKSNNTNLIEDQSSDNPVVSTTNAIVVGHHKLPEKFQPPPNYIQPNNKLIVISNNKDDESFVSSLPEIFGGYNRLPLCPVDNKQTGGKVLKAKMQLNALWKKFDDLMQNKYFWTIFTVLLGSLLPLAKNMYDERKKKKEEELKSRSHSLPISGQEEEQEEEGSTSTETKQSSNSKHSSKKSSHSTQIHESNSFYGSQSTPEINPNGIVKIGKISYDLTLKIGHGCSGTVVYRGTFENRPVAVKRLLPECYTLADREVDLLRDADQHQNVLRYFCTESDAQFRYIALELCQMTLSEYVHNHFNLKEAPKQELKILSILEQAAKGLDHLHSLDIVHRDIKPQNVLISFPDQKGNVFVMISDFGLCKRLELGNNSFSKRSGILGTDGWIAPEILDDIYGTIQEQFENENDPDNLQQDQELEAKPKRITKAVDIFSMGCVFYFVLSGGTHPFGDSIRRQSNILSNQFKLDKLSSPNTETYMQRALIEKMISKEPKERPKAKDVLANPVFWSKAKILQFLQDVSDRIEKIDPSDPILVDLERNANIIIKNNWKTHICVQLQNDLRKFRQYNGVCLRDLLRAIRNKKHHYRELPADVMESLGSLPNDFVDYFTSRFPKLALHVYEAMRTCSNEPMLDVYYHYKEHHF